MYEFLVTSAAGVKQKNRILFILGVALLCIILAVAMPLRTYAVATVVTTICAMVVGGLVGTGVATALSAAGVGIVVALLVGMGVSFTVSMLITAIQAQVDNGNWAAFCSDFVDQWEQRGTTFAALSVTAFYGAKEWVMNHIVKSADETTGGEPTVTNSIYNCAVSDVHLNTGSNLTNFMSANGTVMENVQFSSQEIDTIKSNGGYYTHSVNHDYVNPDTQEVVNFQAFYKMEKVSSSYKLTITQIMSNGGNSVKTVCDIGISSSGINGFKNMPLVCYYPVYEQTRNRLRWLTGYGSTFYDISYNCTLREQYYNNYPVSYESSGDYRMMVDVDGATKYVKVITDAGNRTWYYWGIGQFEYDIFTSSNTVVIENSNIGNVVTSPTYNTTTINNYYTANKDVVSSVANTAHSAVQSGAITNEAAGEIAIGISDTISAENVTYDTIIDEAAAVDDISISDELADVAPIGIFPALVIAGNNIRLGFGDLRYKFPFDVIPAVADWLQALVTPGEPLEIHYTFNVPFGAQTKVIHVDIDFAQYQTLVTVGNWVVLVSCAIGLLLASKKAFQFL